MPQLPKSLQMRNLKTVFQLLLFFLLAGSCSVKEKPVESVGPDAPKPVPAEVAEAIKKEFPGAMPYDVAIDSLLQQLSRVGVSADEILWGQSTCVDDITNTKNKFAHRKIKGPFTFGGLGGLPFTGITGMNAFAHHVPEAGTALLFVGPHIGYNESEGWGKILRHGQHHTSTCCGALYAALEKLQRSEIKAGDLLAEDYQEQVIEQLALRHQDEILKSDKPLLALTRVVFDEAEQQMTQYAHAVHERHFAYAVVVVGVIINTDYAFNDYLWIDHVSVKDIKKDLWLMPSSNLTPNP